MYVCGNICQLYLAFARLKSLLHPWTHFLVTCLICVVLIVPMILSVPPLEFDLKKYRSRSGHGLLRPGLCNTSHFSSQCLLHPIAKCNEGFSVFLVDQSKLIVLQGEIFSRLIKSSEFLNEGVPISRLSFGLARKGSNPIIVQAA